MAKVKSSRKGRAHRSRPNPHVTSDTKFQGQSCPLCCNSAPTWRWVRGRRQWLPRTRTQRRHQYLHRYPSVTLRRKNSQQQRKRWWPWISKTQGLRFYQRKPVLRCHRQQRRTVAQVAVRRFRFSNRLLRLKWSRPRQSNLPALNPQMLLSHLRPIRKKTYRQ